MSLLSQYSFKGNQEKAVTDSARAIAVTAGAGSGKTLSLVGRYLHLLEQGYPLRSILAITFTEKAAREMRSRIRSALHNSEFIIHNSDSLIHPSSFIFPRLTPPALERSTPSAPKSCAPIPPRLDSIPPLKSSKRDCPPPCKPKRLNLLLRGLPQTNNPPRCLACSRKTNYARFSTR